MLTDNAKDISATVVGAGFGIETIYEAVNAILTDGATAGEWAMLARGLFLAIFGYFSFKK